jgi:hypothetical protein
MPLLGVLKPSRALGGRHQLLQRSSTLSASLWLTGLRRRQALVAEGTGGREGVAARVTPVRGRTNLGLDAGLFGSVRDSGASSPP